MSEGAVLRQLTCLVSMQKIRILFSDPLMDRIRKVAEQTDMPISEIVRRATEKWLDSLPEAPRRQLTVPTVDAGRCILTSEAMREAFYTRDKRDFEGFGFKGIVSPIDV
mgnify:CR=1 FL=1